MTSPEARLSTETVNDILRAARDQLQRLTYPAMGAYEQDNLALIACIDALIAAPKEPLLKRAVKGGIRRRERRDFPSGP